MHAVLQRVLLDLQARGVLLVTCSRNDEQTVLQVRSHEQLLSKLYLPINTIPQAWPRACALQPKHFVCHCFGWGEAKSARLAAAATAIGVAHSKLVFVDDSPSERAEVQMSMPQVW